MGQLALPLQLADHAVFESFLSTGNEELVSVLGDIAVNGGDCWVSGGEATGKTHLLQAVCERAGDRSVYVPVVMLGGAGAGILEGLENREIVCLDDIDAVAGDADWESALFSLFNELASAGRSLVVSASAAPRECGFRLPDLESRMSQLPAYVVQALADEDRARALKLRASHRGLELPDETARYLLSRSRRDMASLYRILDTLDAEALRAKRRLTVPFVREVISSEGED
jgi:DnaA family protein